MSTYQNIIKKKIENTKKPVLAEKFNSRTASYVIDDIRVYAVVLDMDTVDAISTPIKFKQYDFGTSFLNIQLMEGEQPLNLEGLSVCGSFRINDNIIVDGALSSQSVGKVVIRKEGIVKVPVPKEILKYSGFVECEIILFNEDGGRTTSPRLSFNISESLINHEKVSGDLPNSDNYPLLITLMNNVNKLHYNTEELISQTTALHNTINENEQVRISQENNRQTSINNMQKSVDSKITEVNNAKNNMETYLSNKVDELYAQVDTTTTAKLEEVDISLQQKLTSVQSQVDTKISEMDNKITDTNNAKLELITNVNKKIEEVSKSESTLVSKVNSKITEVTTAKTQMVGDVTSAISKIDTTISTIQNQFNALAPEQSANAEVQLARTDIEGITHSSLNERLRKIETIPSIIWETVEG